MRKRREEGRANVTSDSYFEPESRRYSRRHSAQWFWATSQPEMCFIAASFPFSIGPCNARAATPLRRSTSRTPAVMATPCRIRERLDQRSKRAEKIVRGNRVRILRLFVKQDVTEIQELVYPADKNAREVHGEMRY